MHAASDPLRVDSARGALVRVVPSDLSFLLWRPGRVDAARGALVRVPSDPPLRSGVSDLAEIVRDRFGIVFCGWLHRFCHNRSFRLAVTFAMAGFTTSEATV